MRELLLPRTLLLLAIIGAVLFLYIDGEYRDFGGDE